MAATPLTDPELIDDQPPRISWRLMSCCSCSRQCCLRYFYLDDLTRDARHVVRRLLEEGTGSFASLILFPIAVLLERRFPLDGGRWRRHWMIHVVGFVVYSVAHTTVIALTRAVIFPALGRGPTTTA
jgi:hypothetical protein